MQLQGSSKFSAIYSIQASFQNIFICQFTFQKNYSHNCAYHCAYTNYIHIQSQEKNANIHLQTVHIVKNQRNSSCGDRGYNPLILILYILTVKSKRYSPSISLCIHIIHIQSQENNANIHLKQHTVYIVKNQKNS